MSKRLNMAKWIVALRSGRYRQGKGALKDIENQYCCLGVACQISKLGRWKNDDGEIEYVIGKDANNGVLPNRVSSWLGVEFANPVLEEDFTVGYRLSATVANDEEGLTFREIADKLEVTYLPGTTAKAVIAKAKKRASN